MRKIGIMVLATNAYFVLGIRLIKRFMEFYKGESEIRFYFFSDTDPSEYLPNTINVLWMPTKNNSWQDGTNLKFNSILRLFSIDRALKADYLFYLDADTNVSKPFMEDWFLGEMVGGQHYGDQTWMKSKKGYDRNSKSKAYVPYHTDLPQMYYYGAFFGGEWSLMMYFCRVLANWQEEDALIPYEPAVNDESYINAWFHYNPPKKTVLCADFAFDISDKGGIGNTRKINLDISQLKAQLKLNKDNPINIQNGQCITYDLMI